jgi:hypothetical protein
MDNEQVSALTPEQELAAAFTADMRGEDYTLSTDKPAETPAPEVAEAQTPPPEVEAQAPEVQPPTAPTFSPFEIEWKGQKVTIDSVDKAREYAAKGFDYTQKTQSLAEERRLIQAERERLASEYQQREIMARQALNALQNPDFLRARLQALTGAATPAASPAAQPVANTPDPDDFVTVKDLEQARAEATRLVQEASTRAVQEAQERVRAELDQLEMKRLEVSYRNDFDSTVDQLMVKEFPVLAEAYDASEIKEAVKAEGRKFLRAQMELNPGQEVSPAAVKQAMAEAARQRALRIEAMRQKWEKAEVTRKATLMQSAPEPPGGTPPPQPAPQRFTSLNDPALTRTAIDDVEAIFRAMR